MSNILRIRTLTDRFFDGNTTLDEEQELYDYYSREPSPPPTCSRSGRCSSTSPLSSMLRYHRNNLHNQSGLAGLAGWQPPQWPCSSLL